MNMHISISTPTEFAAAQRSRQFHDKIAARAALLQTVQPSVTFRVPDPGQIFGLPDFYFQAPRGARTASLHPTVKDIVREVAFYFSITTGDLMSARRTHAVVWPRQVAYYLSKELTPHSLPAIGRLFGGKDHTTILHGFRRCESAVYSDRRSALDILALTFAITGEQPRP